ncbi:MAG: Tex family protein [Planctomycetaceae bacterium]
MSEPGNVDYERVAGEVGVTVDQVRNVMSLLDEGNTVPFVTRYRKERTGNLDEEQIRAIQGRVTALRQVAERAQTILRLIDAQGKLTPQLRAQIESTDTLKRLEDLYLPYRPKRRSRAAEARERGLLPLAERVWNQDASLGELDAAASGLIDVAGGLSDTAAVLQGVVDILAERIGEDADVRARCRRIANRSGKLTVAATKEGEEKGSDYRNYFQYSEEVTKIPPHRIMALNRGEKAGFLRIRFEWDRDRALTELLIFLRLTEHRYGDFARSCVVDALTRFIHPGLERELRRELTERAESHSVTVFARNLRNLLLQPPLRNCRVLAIDPGYRTGCKLAVIDEFGNCLKTDLVFATGSAEKKLASRQKLVELLREYDYPVVAIGNGTACRETEEFVSEIIAEEVPGGRYLIVNESGASIYSTSQVARDEFPDFDATVRGTISIGRRLQDPLSELVKIDPQHIGVGMYQHDVGTRRLKESLDGVIESCVNYVGVELNTASASLLRYVSGFNQLVARRVVEWRSEHGRFSSREQLRQVNGIGDAVFTQAAGFLKIADGDEPLDNTWIHPESYNAARDVLKLISVEPGQLTNVAAGSVELTERLSQLDCPSLSQQFGVGLPTLNDIVESLMRPGRDPRADLPGPLFKGGILKLDDLCEGIELTGTVLNVVDFGAFVDVGLKDSGLVHISQLSRRYIASPHDIVAVGDLVTVWVLGIDRERRRVSLTMIRPKSRGEIVHGAATAPSAAGPSEKL